MCFSFKVYFEVSLRDIGYIGYQGLFFKNSAPQFASIHVGSVLGSPECECPCDSQSSPLCLEEEVTARLSEKQLIARDTNCFYFLLSPH